MITYQKKGDSNEMFLHEKNGVPFFMYRSFCDIPWLSHCFSTRLGGSSKGDFSAMNLGFLPGEDPDAVRENYRRLGEAAGFSWENAVLSQQTHTTNVRVVKKEDAGKGLFFERDYSDVDGLITNEKNLPLVTFYADCVPLYFVDVKNKAIGLSHSGWRGTVGRIGEKTLKKMEEAYGTKPEDVIAAIGPSICKDCFEVGPEVVEAFCTEFGEKAADTFVKPGEGDRSYLDLWRFNRQVLIDAGVDKERILLPNVCTKCNPNLLFSHRVMGKKRGTLAAVLSIEDKVL